MCSWFYIVFYLTIVIFCYNSHSTYENIEIQSLTSPKSLNWKVVEPKRNLIILDLRFFFIFRLLSFIWIYFSTDLLNINYESVTMLDLRIFRVFFIKRDMFYHLMPNLLYIY